MNNLVSYVQDCIVYSVDCIDCIVYPSSVAESLRRRLCNQKIAGSNPASGYLATPFRKEI